jgi:branched-chain amino acid transport system permease protein
MAILVPTLISGLTVGVMYGLFACGTVVLYRATGLVNFALGGLATVATFIVWHLMVRAGWPTWPAIVTGLATAAGLGVLCYLLVIRPRDGSERTNLLMRTLALSLLLQAVMTLAWGQGQPFTFPSPVPADGLRMGGLHIPGNLLAALGLAVLTGGGFWFLFTRTRIGLLMRAVADSSEVAGLLGVRTRVVAATAWALSTVVAYGIGLLTAPTLLLSTHMLDSFLLFAFTAVVVGGLTSFAGGFVGGILIGLLSTTTSVFLAPEWSVVSVFSLLLGTLLIRPAGIFGRLATERL